MEVEVLDTPDGNVIGRGKYLGVPEAEFIVGEDGQVYFHHPDDKQPVWAGPNAAAFRLIAAAWERYRVDCQRCQGEAAQLELVSRLRGELGRLGALPTDLRPAPEPLWSFLLFEAENGLG